MDYAFEPLVGGLPSCGELWALCAWMKDMDDGSAAACIERGYVALLFRRLESVERVLVKGPGDLEAQLALLRCVKALMGTGVGLKSLCGSEELVGRLALCLDSDDVGVCTQVLELLAVLAVSQAKGHASVLWATEYFAAVKKEVTRYESLVACLTSPDCGVDFRRDVMLFVNTLVNSSPDVERRVSLRRELQVGQRGLQCSFNLGWFAIEIRQSTHPSSESLKRDDEE